MTKKKTAGDRLRERLDSALARAGEDARCQLEWTPMELIILDRAADAANRHEILSARWDRLAASPTVESPLLVKVSAELRSLERQVADLTARVSPEPVRKKSDQHQRAARSRWDREF
ncbi:hypothetical protein ACWDTP_05040 [Mycobacterium sp. NPDC003449]